MNLQSVILLGSTRRERLGTTQLNCGGQGSGPHKANKQYDDDLDSLHVILQNISKHPNAKELIQKFLSTLSVPRYEASVAAGGVGSGRHSEGGLKPQNKPFHHALLKHGFSYKGTKEGVSVYHHPQTGMVEVKQGGATLTPEKELDKTFEKHSAKKTPSKLTQKAVPSKADSVYVGK